MAATDDLKRWFKDQVSRDPDLAETPGTIAAKLAPVMDQLSSEERRNNLAHLRAYSDLYYQGRHNMAVPKEMTDQIRQLEQRAQRLETVDQAREIVQSFGGPPSERTIAESLERSRLARQVNAISETQTPPEQEAKERIEGKQAEPPVVEKIAQETAPRNDFNEPVAQRAAEDRERQASRSEKSEIEAGERVPDSQKVASGGERSRADLIRELREFSKQSAGLRYVPAEAAIAANLANQLESGAKTIDLSQRYATSDTNAAEKRHQKALKNLEPALREVAKQGQAIQPGQAIAHGVRNQEVLAVNTGIKNGLQKANGILQSASSHNHHAVQAPKLSLGGGL